MNMGSLLENLKVYYWIPLKLILAVIFFILISFRLKNIKAKITALIIGGIFLYLLVIKLLELSNR